MRGNCIETGVDSVMRWINEGAQRDLKCGEIFLVQCDQKTEGLVILWLVKSERQSDQALRFMGFKPKTGGEFIGPAESGIAALKKAHKKKRSRA